MSSAEFQTLLHYPGPAGGHPGALPGTVRLAPTALRIRDRAVTHRPPDRGRGDPFGIGAGSERGGVGRCLAAGLGEIHGDAVGISIVFGVREQRVDFSPAAICLVSRIFEEAESRVLPRLGFFKLDNC